MNITKVSCCLAILILARDTGASAQVTSRPKPPQSQGFIEGMFSDLTAGNRYRPIADPDRYMDRFGNLEDRTEPQLHSAYADLEKMRQIDGRNWQEIQRARRNSKFRLPLDQPLYVARMYETATQRQREIDRIDDEEDAAFKAINGPGFSLKPGFFDPTPLQKEKIREWTSARRNEPFDKRRQEVQERFRQRLEDISTDYRNQTDPGEKNLDQLQQDMLARYQRIVAAQRKIQAELDRRHDVAGAVPPENPNEARSGSLVLNATPGSLMTKVNVPVEIHLTVSGGMPPYELTLERVEGDVIAQVTMTRPDYFDLPISFAKEDTYVVYCRARDSDNPRKEAKVAVRIRVTDDKPAAPEPPNPPDTTKPQTPPKPPEPPKPETPPPYKPWVLPAGSYQGHLFLGLDLFGPYRKGAYAIRIPYPVTFSIDAAGKITGRGEWHLNPGEINPAAASGPNIEYKTDLSYRLEGQCDLATGAIRLRVVDFVSQQRSITRNPAGDSVSAYDLEVEFENTGWQTGHPTLTKPLTALADIYRRMAVDPAAAADLEQAALPVFSMDSADRLVYRDRGWAGIPEMTGTDKNIKVSKGPGGESLVTVRKSVSWIESGPQKLPGSERDSTADLQKGWQGRPSTWFLKVLGQAPPPVQPPTPPLPAAIKGELAAFGLWPRGETTARPGEPFALDAMGVLVNDPYEPVKLNDRVTWNLPNGLSRGLDGRITATAPGTYMATATIRRPDGGTMSDTITIRIIK